MDQEYLRVVWLLILHRGLLQVKDDGQLRLDAGNCELELRRLNTALGLALANPRVRPPRPLSVDAERCRNLDDSSG
jgi:hypothetical protein